MDHGEAEVEASMHPAVVVYAKSEADHSSRGGGGGGDSGGGFDIGNLAGDFSKYASMVCGSGNLLRTPRVFSQLTVYG